MQLVQMIVKEETYTFTPNDGDAPIHILSGRLREWLHEHAMHNVINLTFPEQTLARIVEMHGLEKDRMRSMTRKEAEEPVIVGLYPNGVHILIDGGHRRWYWAKRGRNVIRGWAVPEVIWREFLFDPASPSTILHHQDGSSLPQRRKK